MIYRQSGRRSLRGLCVVLGIVMVSSACFGPRSSSPESSAEVQELRLKAGDHIRVVTIGRQRYSLEITEIRDAEMAGVTLARGDHEDRPTGEIVTLPYRELALLEVRRFSGERTSGLIVGSVLVVGIAGMLVVGVPVATLAPGP